MKFSKKNLSGTSVYWLLSAYRADSHAAWATWLINTFGHINWQYFELPGNHFPWRIRSNPLSWLDQIPDLVPDRIWATSMVDMATFKGLNPRLAKVPVWYYFHENQFAYPKSKKQAKSTEPQMVQLYGALAADRLLFNSRFNQNSFLTGIEEFLQDKSDVNSASVLRRLAPKSEVLPIPVEKIPPAEDKDPALILWNHRWEYDKSPQIFAEAMIRLAEHGIDFRLALLGDRSEKPHQALVRLREALPGRILIDEKADRKTYRKILGKAGIVVSTAIHEFQGLAMLEAAGAGARPVVPDKLCYPEQYGEIYRCKPGDPDALCDRICNWLKNGLPPAADVSFWHSKELLKQWETLLYEPMKAEHTSKIPNSF